MPQEGSVNMRRQSAHGRIMRSHPPSLHHTIDVPSVHRPLTSLISADVVSARRPLSLPLEVAERGKLYSGTSQVKFDTCVNGERGKRRADKEMTYSGIEREINEL